MKKGQTQKSKALADKNRRARRRQAIDRLQFSPAMEDKIQAELKRYRARKNKTPKSS